MASADRTNNTEQLQRFIDNLCQHRRLNEFCDFTLTTNNTSIACHKLVLSSASSYFSLLFCGPEQNSIDVTPLGLPESILRTVVDFMYNSKYVIADQNVAGLLKLSKTWRLDILTKLCIAYMNENITINNACRFYNCAMDNVDRQKSQIINRFIREHFTSLHESGLINELSLKNFTTIIEYDEINVKDEDVIFSSAVQITKQQTPLEDVNRCLKLIRFSHMSRDFLASVVLNHQLINDPPRNTYLREAQLYQKNERSTPDVKPPRYWGKSGICYISKDHCMYQYISKDGNRECVKMMELPEWTRHGCSVASCRDRVVIVEGWDNDENYKRALLLDKTDNTKVTKLPNLHQLHKLTGVVLSYNDVYVVGYDNSYASCLVYYLSLDSDAWQIKKSMLHVLRSSLVIQHQQCIYVLGGYNKNCYQSSSVYQYIIRKDKWKQCSDMPIACTSEAAGIVVHDDGIKVITVESCLMYAADTDTWTVKSYNKLGSQVKAIVRRGQICAVVQDDVLIENGRAWSRDFSTMSYDDVENVWKTVTKFESMDDVWDTTFFC